MNSIIDAHHHLWDLAVTPQPWLDEAMGPINQSFSHDDLLRAVGSRVESTVIVQTVSDVAETELMLEIAERSALVGGVVGWVDLTAVDVADRLAALTGSPTGSWLRGIRHQVHDEPDVEWIGRSDVRRGLAALGAAGLVFDLLLRPEHLRVAAEVVRDLPDVTFVLDHIAKPRIADGELDGWAADIRRLASLPNVMCKLSGLVTEADWAAWTTAELQPFADVVLDAFGPNRVMFGSDWPVCLLAASYDDVVESAVTLTAACSATEQAAVFSGNAAEVYRLHLGPAGPQPAMEEPC